MIGVMPATSDQFRVVADFKPTGDQPAAIDALTERILVFQGDGDYTGVADFVAEMAVVHDALQSDLDRLDEAGIPVDIVFEQGAAVLGI